MFPQNNLAFTHQILPYECRSYTRIVIIVNKCVRISWPNQNTVLSLSYVTHFISEHYAKREDFNCLGFKIYRYNNVN
jgi:hypothetical protein